MIRLTFLLVAALAGVASSRTHRVECGPGAACGDAAKYGDGFAWQTRGPLEFLSELRSIAARRDPAGPPAIYSVYGEHLGWVQESDVRQLMGMIDSTAKCAAVVSTLSSVLPSEESTVGREAMFLIEGYRAGRYPSAIGSNFCTCDAEEIRRWWGERPHGQSGS